MINSQIQNRYQAFIAHLIFSAVVALIVLALVFLIWYPGKIAAATGVDEIFFIVLGVDVCLGPLLTLVVFNLKKKELKRDLLIICSIQLAALFYGIYTVGVVRPVYVVFEIDRFALVYANDLSEDKRANATYEEFKTMPYFGPRWVSALLPKDIEERNELLFSTISGGEDLGQFPKYYVPYDESTQEIIDHLQPMTDLKDYNLNNLQGYDALISKYPPDTANVGFLPMKGFVADLVVVVDRSNGNKLELVDLRPWGE